MVAFKTTRKVFQMAGITLTGLLAGNILLASAGADQSSPAPVRIKRSFFQKNVLVGRLQVTSDSSGFTLDLTSPLVWNEKPTSQTAPTEGTLADFRDQQGCADYYKINEIAVCFTIMGDVYSLGVNPREMQLKGIDRYINHEYSASKEYQNCPSEIKDLKWTSANRISDQGFSVSYTGSVVPLSDCQPASKTVSVQLRIQRT